MTNSSSIAVKVLVAIANYGTGNDRYLSEVVREYRSMPFDVDIVVLSNVPKTLGPGVEVVIVDLQNKNPSWLPFPHKEIFASRLNDYDLFIYSEDDMLITEKNLQAFLEVSSVLPEGEIAGFFRFEEGPDRSHNFPDVHGHFHWDPESVRSRGEHIFAVFTNAHSACYVLTRQQLRRAIDCGGFLVGLHHGTYDRICTAGTDPYTQCGLQKVICISDLESFMIHHLSNKYVGTAFGVSGPELRRQVDVLLQIGKNGRRPASLFQTQTKLMNAYYSKNYYEPIRSEILSAVPSDVRSVLSIGCGWGALEMALVERGLRVVAVPIDPVIAEGAGARGVDIVAGDFATARKKLDGERFDCLVILDVLHLVPDPSNTLSLFAQLLRSGATTIVQVPRVVRQGTIVRIIRGNQTFKDLGNYQKTGVHLTSRRVLRRWLENAGFTMDSTIRLLFPTAAKVPRLVQWLFNPAGTEEKIVAVARKT